MDHYYPEEQMNQFRTRCETKLAGLKKEVEALDGKVGGLKHLIAEERALDGKPKLHDGKDLMNEFTAFLAEQEPLIMSLLYTAVEDLKTLHGWLDALVFSSSTPKERDGARAALQDLDGLKAKTKGQEEFLLQMQGYQKEIDHFVD